MPLIPSPNGWRLDLEALKKAGSTKTKMVVMSPGFPSGISFNQQEWDAVAELCKKTDAWLLYDAALERIIYNNRPIIHPATLPDMRERTITVGAASKELRMIGWRIGWVVGPQAIMNDIGLVSISNVVCQTGISMAGVAAALNAEEKDGLKEALEIWQERRDVLMHELKDLPVTPPHAGWSLLIDASQLGMTSQEFSQRLFEKAKIASTPMCGWGDQAVKYVRFVYANEPKERLVGMGIRLKKILD